MGGFNLQEIWLPDRVGTIGGVWTSSFGDMTDKVPGPCSVGTGIQVDAGAVVAPAVTRTHDGASRVASQRLRELSQSGLCTESPAIDLIGQVGDVRPVSTSILAFEDREVVRVVTGQRGGGDDGAVLQLGVTRVGDTLVASRLIDGVVREVSPWLWLLAPAGRRCNDDLRKKRRSSNREEHLGGSWRSLSAVR